VQRIGFRSRPNSRARIGIVSPFNPFVRRIQIQNYKSIRSCDVELGPLAILVGPNGSGKSNFLDALRFTADALSTTLDNALRERGGVHEVRRRSGGHPNHFAIRIDFELRTGESGHYAFKVGAVRDVGFRVTDEECAIRGGEFGALQARYRVKAGEVSTSVEERLPVAADDRLYLVSVSALSAFRPVFEALTSMGFYNLNPAAMRQPQQPDPGTLLRRDGSNLASVLAQLEQRHPAALERVVEYLRRVAPGVEGVEKASVGPMETIVFRQQVSGQTKPWRFYASNISDGTLRGLGVLVAMLQRNGAPPSLVGIEEPETALHPAAVGILIDAIRDAAQQTQILVTSHSPELLDRNDVTDDQVLAVVSDQGVTTVGRVDESTSQVLREGLFTPGELLRLSRLEPSAAERQAASTEQLRLFES